jgi:transmembrane sensor
MAFTNDNPEDNPPKLDQTGLAIEWFAKQRNGQQSAEDHQQFGAWLNASPAHQQAYQEVAAFWQDPGFHKALSGMPLSADKLIQFPNCRRPYRKPVTIAAMAACIALVAVISQANLSCLQADYCTATGEIRSIKLADDSTVTLNSQTAVNVNYKDNLRTILLVTGEAYFEVQHNPDKPFVVEGHYSQTRVLGTRFIVREDKLFDTVTVNQGVVEVSQNNQKPRVLHVNDQLIVGEVDASGIQKVSAISAGAWAKGHLVFDNTNLGSVVKEIERYRKGKVIIKNQRLQALKVSGRFDIRDTDKALEALEQTLPIKLYRLTPWLVVIT